MEPIVFSLDRATFSVKYFSYFETLRDDVSLPTTASSIMSIYVSSMLKASIEVGVKKAYFKK